MRGGAILSRLLILLGSLLLAAAAARADGAGCPPAAAPYPPFYDDPALFERAFAKAEAVVPAQRRLTGITVPHHLVADHLIALGFRAAAGHRYRRIVILAPDHFRRSEKMFATTGRDFDTVLGPVRADRAGAARLLASGFVADSCLFDRDHGVRALLPFVRRTFPDAEVLPVAISIKSKRADWDRMAAALAPLIDADTLVVESTDFSHYLPHHEAILRDQQSLNVIASGSADAVALLRQPDHLDSLGALYIQLKLQAERNGARPVAVANENQQQYQAIPTDSTTSYVVLLFAPFAPQDAIPALPAARIYYLAGDTNFGRAMKHALLADGAAERVEAGVRSITGGRPLVVNLEGVILPNVPEAIDDMTLAMPADLTLDWLRRLGVAGVGLANNHTFDLGASGYAETAAALDAAGIPHFAQGERLDLPGLAIVGLSDLDTNGSPQVDLITPELLDRLAAVRDGRPTVAFVHWGREYVAAPARRERELAEAMRARAATVVVGGHPHVASSGVTAHAGGAMAEVYSLGNFLFDQGGDRSSGQLVELRVFDQGTVFVRTVPLPNLFELAAGAAARPRAVSAQQPPSVSSR